MTQHSSVHRVIIHDNRKKIDQLKRIIATRGGKVVVIARDQAQLTAARNAMAGQEDIIVLGQRKFSMGFTITGIWKGYGDEDLLEMICKENEDLARKFGENISEQCK